MDKNNKSSRLKSYLYVSFSFISIILLFFLTGCQIMKHDQKDMSNTYYFSGPAEAVPIITDLLEKKNFEILSRYYDLSNSDIALTELESGDFFIQKERPEIAHPAGFWRYKHPFAPGFKYQSVRASDKDSIYIVEVSISIDQGAGSPGQMGLSYFYMIKSDKGWKLLPDPVAEDEIPGEMPETIQ